MARSKAARLTQSLEFDRVYSQGKAYRGKLFSVHTFPNRSGTPRLGLSVSRKVGSAVTRNYVRRRLREIFYSTIQEMPEDLDIVISARPAASKADYATLDSEFRRVLEKITETGNRNRD